MLKRIPNVFVIVFALIVVAALATWLLPGGKYERKKVQLKETTRTVLVEGSYRTVPADPQILEVFTAPIKGFVKLAQIIAFIFIVGGAFYMFNETGAVTAGIGWLVRRLQGKEILVIPIVMTVFSFFGAAFGMCEEAMPFALIFVPLALSLGYDSLVGVSLSFLAAGVGFAGAFFNPFTLQIAQGLAGIEPLSGMGYRIVVWLIVTTMAIVWVMVYAARIKKRPELSPTYELDCERRRELASEQASQADLTRRHILVLGLLGAGVVAMIGGVIWWKWYIVELAGLFFCLGVLAGVVAGQSPNELAASFIAGCKDIASAALVVGFAGGIIVILEDGRVLDTLLHGLAGLTGELHPVLAAYTQYFIQMAVNLFIPSGSTKAALTMPLMAPLADLSGISRQTAVLAYQFGDGFTNMIIPTSGVTVGTLAMARVPYERWFRWNFPLQIVFFCTALILLAWPALTGWT